MKNLENKFRQDFVSMGILDRVPIVMKKYSKTRWGRYNPNKDEIIIYVYASKDCREMIDYHSLFKALLHEYVHWVQYHSKSWKRQKGVMHDEEFWKMYHSLLNTAVKRGILYEWEIAEV